jgi:hypothetical protein
MSYHAIQGVIVVLQDNDTTNPRNASFTLTQAISGNTITINVNQSYYVDAGGFTLVANNNLFITLNSGLQGNQVQVYRFNDTRDRFEPLYKYNTSDQSYSKPIFSENKLYLLPFGDGYQISQTLRYFDLTTMQINSSGLSIQNYTQGTIRANLSGFEYQNSNLEKKIYISNLNRAEKYLGKENTFVRINSNTDTYQAV